MLIMKTVINLFYPNYPKIGRRIFDFEDKLNEYFGPFQLIPVPEDAPAEIPRISAVSKHSHSQLNISSNNVSFITNYDDNYNYDWSNCLFYLKERIEKIVPILSTEIDTYLFSGITTEILMDDINKPREILKNFIKIESESNPYDINLKLTFAIEESHYINITFSNLRYKRITPLKQASPVLKNSNEGLRIILDVNDRYGFNYLGDYKSSQDKLKKNIDITNHIIINRMEEIIRTGVINL